MQSFFAAISAMHRSKFELNGFDLDSGAQILAAIRYIPCMDGTGFVVTGDCNRLAFGQR